MNNFLQLIFTTLEMGGVTALATMGVILIFRTSSAFNYAQGVIAMFCAFIAAHALQTLGWNVYAATIVGLVAALLLGIIIDRLIISRTITMHSVSKQIITLGLVIVLLGLAPMLFG
ncbi:MAG: branched-chain amino acid ABC transporter permease, partial [Defluviitaleaceae bacterium]|nr:branched-chain amino acid ABC transporter permease [Defluviitaleaceae bacterium]